ncbi:MAG: putative bifunctional diguanylate cyclase/phosphodiesterase [Actinomycetota bacterium]
MARIRLLTLAIAGAAAALYLAHVRFLETVEAPFSTPWWLLAAMFFIVESYVVHFEFRRHAHSFTLSEIPLVLGMFFVGPTALVAAQVAGLSVGLLRRRQAPLKYLFNVSNLCLTVTLALSVFHGLGGAEAEFSARSVLAVFLATLAASILAMCNISLAIRLSGGEPDAGFWTGSFPLGFGITLTNTSLGLIAAALLWLRPGLAWLLVVPTLVLYLAYRSHTSQREKHQSLQGLYESSRLLHRTMDGEKAVADMLEQARAMFKAEIAEMILFAAHPGEVHVRAQLGRGDELKIDRLQELDPADRMCSRVALGDTSLLISDPSEQDLRDELERRGFRDAIATALHAEDGVVGTIMVADRLGEVSTFRPRDVKLLETLANNTSAALENIRLAQRLKSEAEEKKYQALHDALTGLPNRALFHERVNHAIDVSRRSGKEVAVLLMDLDGFREVNDTLGHHNGDLLLQEVAGRLQAVLQPGDLAARLGGDEFAVLLPVLDGSDDALLTAAAILHSLEPGFVVDGVTLEARASIGVAIYPHHGDDPNLLIQRADVAMYVAKDTHSGCEIYSTDKDPYSAGRLSLAAELRHAMERGEIVVHYQPKADLRDGSLTGAEALVRWNHPVRGPIGPNEFIPIAEQTGLVKPLTLYVLEEALKQVSRWNAQGLDLAVAVNLSARNLLDLELPDQVARLLARWSIPPAKLGLEITESFIMADPIRAKAVVDRLHEMGVVLAIDDFGTGYSSLAYLKRLPIHELKIDRSFVAGMMEDDNDAVIVRSTIELGRNLGLKVIAEGVETQAIWEELGSMGCDVAQGYLLSRPLPPNELVEWASRRSAPEDLLTSMVP